MENNKTGKIQLSTRRRLRITAIAVIICASGFINVTRHSNIRTVDILSILALGIAVGACAVNLALMLRLKKTSNN